MGRRLSPDEHLDWAEQWVRDLYLKSDYGSRGTPYPEVMRALSPRAGYRALAAALASTIDRDRMREFVEAVFTRGSTVCDCRLCVPTGDPRRSRSVLADPGCWCAVCQGRSPEWGMAEPNLVALAAVEGLQEWPVGHRAAMWVRSDERTARLLGEHASWWYLGEEVVVLAAPAEDVRYDAAGRLHSTDGPAARYSDGWEVHARHGVLVPPGHADGSITVAEISRVENMEVRRELIDLYGPARFVADAKGRKLAADETGELWEVWPGEIASRHAFERMRLIRVVDATPGPDGTARVYWLHVPPETSTARAGVAWSFGLDPSGYRPLVET